MKIKCKCGNDADMFGTDGQNYKYYCEKCYRITIATIAPTVEQRFCKPIVGGSIPSSGSNGLWKRLLNGLKNFGKR